MSDDPRRIPTITAGVVEALRDMGHPVPAGHLYAILMGAMTVGEFQMMLQRLTDLDMIRVSNHLIEWIGEPVRRRG